MAEENEEYDQLLEEINVNLLMVLQAYIRGTLTRKWLKVLRLEYQQIGQEIERKDLNIEWSSKHPCLPKLSNKRKLPKNEKKSRDIKFSVEIQTDFETFPEVKDNQLNSLCALGTESDPVVINDSVLDVSNVSDPKQNRLDSLDSIPVRDSDSSHSPVIPNEQLNKEVTSDINLDQQNSSVPNHEGTTVKEMTRIETSVMCDVTSVWDAELSSFATEEIRLPTEKNELKELRKNLAMELLWIQQAIQSRKNYLHLKTQMGS